MLTASFSPTSDIPVISENRNLRSRSISQHFRSSRIGQSKLSAPSAETLSDSLSLATTATEGTIGEVWEQRHCPVMPLGCAVQKCQPPSILNLPNPSHQHPLEKDLYEFLKDAELDHYYSVLTRHLKIRSIQQIKYVEDSDLAELGFSRPEQRRLRKHFKRECPQTAMGKLRKRLARSTSSRCSSPRFKDTLDGLSSRNINVLPISLDTTPTSEDGDSKRRTLLFTQNSKSHDNTNNSACLTEDLHNLNINRNTNYRIIRSSELEIGSSLGEGEFGKVFQGVWHTDTRRVVQVAVKIMNMKHMNDEETCVFLNEISIMHQLDHPDIVRLLGVCIDANTIKIVTELAPLRSLLECLRESELRSSFSVPVLYKFSIQIARGMSYLEECGLVHRDLAARNILVFSKDIIKISDFGMSRALQLGKSYYQSNLNVNLPIAWCAPECIHESSFTIHSDMWAYGITLWEIFTYGFTPWAGLTGRQVLEMIDSPRFGRLDQPDCCPDPIYDAVMRACWAHEPKARPTFAQLLGMLPRLSPEIWITTNEYRPDTDPNLDSISTTEEFPYNPGFRPHGTRSLSRPLFIRANETVCILGKRSSSTWKVVNLRTGLVGCIPSGILKPYVIPGNDSSTLHDHHTLTKNSNSINNTGSISNSMGLVAKTRLRISRRASLTDLALRKTVCRLSKLSLVNPTEHSNNNSSSSGTTSRSRTKLTADQISLPQNDFRHIGHVGSDGRTFGKLGLVGKIVIDSKDNLSDSQSLHDFNVSEETYKFTKANNMTNKSNTLQINPSSVKTYQSKPADMSKDVDLFSTKIISKVNDSTKAPIDKITTTSFNKNSKRSDNSDTDLFDDIKFNVISESNGFDLGSSLLDEVFKCFPLDNSTAEKTNHNVEDINEPDTTATTSDNKGIGSHSDYSNKLHVDSTLTDTTRLKSTDCLNNESTTNSPTFTLTSDLTEHDRQLSKSNGLRLSYLTNKMDLLDTSTRINTNNNHNSKINKQNNHTNALNSFASSYQTQRTLNCEHIDDVSIDSSYTDENTIIDNTIDVDDKHKNIKCDIKTESKFSWKHNSFGSLTRRSSSISKTLNKTNLITGFNQSDDNKRLTISRPVLLSRPNSITQTSLNRLPSNSSSSASIIGTLTEPSSLGSSRTSRDSSLTVVSSSNGCNSSSGVGGEYASSLSNGHDEISVQELQQQNPHQSTLSSCNFEISTNASLSPAPSLSSMISTTSSVPSHSLTSSITNNSTSLHCNSASTAQGCLRALRSGETVFRASMNTSTGNALNARRKFSTPSRTNIMLSADERPTNSRIQNLSPSVTLISLSTKSSTNDTTATTTTAISSSLLRSKSKLLFNRDIYQASSSTERSPNRPSVTGTVTGGHTLQKYKDLNRTHLSHSSSSSSSISPPSTPFLGGESTVQYSNTNHSQSNHPMVTLTTKTLTGDNDNNISNIDLDCVVSSFLGKDFASFLDNSANNNNNVSDNDDDHLQLYKTRVPLNFQSNLSKSPFKSSLSRLPSQLGNLRSTDNNEDDDVLAI
ncbi:hypothetical protein MN116_002477 [Schistosoma mekongi]|uniref:non-specific protein-tyrosine kinase n=1 Tax=Schistosoma mekongi TaxID=38744 RepID=A0AAE2D8W5_SCHME|nr:hypothetical protein MN116_002477 [Schistosoma mekongi]